MLRYGTITPVSRDGISRDVGPIAKGLFEKTVENFAESSCFAEKDMMKGVAASIMYGTLAPVGTGTVEIKDGDRIPSRRFLKR
jgi:DNA-directed RNA polymerase beta' subunit